METYLVPMWVVECGVQRDGCISMVKAADAQATVEALQAQLPAEMQECTILFKECEKGHGRLTATNWIDHGCQTCAMEALQRVRDEFERERDQLHAALMEAVLLRDHNLRRCDVLDSKYKKELAAVKVLQSQLSQLKALVRAFIEAWDHDGEPSAVAYEDAVARARATLDATTPAGGGQDGR